MQPGETIQKSLQRLGKKSAQISSKERFARKKAGIVDEDAALITEITELSNKILTKMGNMDIYQETYEDINSRFASKLKGSGALSTDEKKKVEEDDELDMYADDFDTKEKQKKMTDDSTKPTDEAASEREKEETRCAISNEVKWEFKWKQEDTDTHGPYSTEQMQHWVDQGFFKDGVFVRKAGDESQFHSSNRVDFELYL